MNRMTHWEWFSLRFFDHEEMMLFTFPQDSHQDGTYIPRAGGARRLTEYTIRPLDFVLVNDVKFSTGWTLAVPGGKVNTVLIDRMNYHYADWVFRQYGLEDSLTGDFFQRTGRKLACDCTKFGIACDLTPRT